jgi:hypothetical protein
MMYHVHLYNISYSTFNFPKRGKPTLVYTVIIRAYPSTSFSAKILIFTLEVQKCGKIIIQAVYDKKLECLSLSVTFTLI